MDKWWLFDRHSLGETSSAHFVNQVVGGRFGREVLIERRRELLRETSEGSSPA
jgi:hypothetical protein